jgi:hypothetical protein
MVRGPAQTSEPIIQYLYQLIEAIAEGRLLIPKFQRPLVWKWDRQSELLRSVKDGIPIGAVMIWRTPGERIKAQEELAGHSLPTTRPEIPHEYLLDGLQRLSTLFAALKGLGVAHSREDFEFIGYSLSECAFVNSYDARARDVVPLSVLSDSVALLRYQRSLSGPSVNIWIERSDSLARAFREYKVPVIPIVSDDFDVAARTFNLINSQGVRMGEADMIHALSWSPTFELRDRLESLRAEVLEPAGWGDIEFETVLKVVKAEADIDLYEEAAEEVSNVLKLDPPALDRAADHLVLVALFLRKECGIRDWQLVPYSLQAVLLAEAFRLGASLSIPLDARRGLLRDWFWMTTYGEMFAGLSGYRLGLALQAIRESMTDGILRWSGASPFGLRSLPKTADFRAVRIKALALQLAREQEETQQDRTPFATLAAHKRNAMIQLIPRRLLSKEQYSSPGNRFLCAPEDATALRQTVLNAHFNEVTMRKHFITPAAATYAARGLWDEFVEDRLRELAFAERGFVDGIVHRHPAIMGEPEYFSF